MPVIVLTTITPPPPPPTGLGGDFIFPVTMIHNNTGGSMRLEGETDTFTVSMSDNSTYGSLRSPDDVVPTLPGTGGDLAAGSPNYGEV